MPAHLADQLTNACQRQFFGRTSALFQLADQVLVVLSNRELPLPAHQRTSLLFILIDLPMKVAKEVV